jgi:putative FmdB family regulatory protein
MPTYEYQCKKCKKSFETFQSMKDDALKTCPKELCQQKTWGKGSVVRQLGTGAGLIFKGSGFYITDYRSEGYKAAAKSDASGGTSAGASGTASSAGDAGKKAGGKPKKE